MGELDLDYIERLLVPEWLDDDCNGDIRKREVPTGKKLQRGQSNPVLCLRATGTDDQNDQRVSLLSEACENELLK